jgi:hypothetical protein
MEDAEMARKKKARTDLPMIVGTVTHRTDSVLAPSTAVFLERNSWTNGINWIGKYGDHGYSLMDLVPDVIPPLCSVSVDAVQGIYDWYPIGTYADPRLLAIPGMPGQSGLNSAFGDLPVTATFLLDDGISHSVALYFVDPSQQGRNLSVTAYDVTDPANPIYMSSLNVSDCAASGVFMIYNVTGHVQFSIVDADMTNLNAVLMAWFIGPHLTIGTLKHSTDSHLAVQAGAVFTRQDDSTQGTWIGAYGAQGYSINNLGNAPDVLPPKCSVSLAGGSYANWFGPKTDYSWDASYLLQVPSMPGATGAMYYWGDPSWGDPSPPITITFDFTDGLTHAVALYIGNSYIPSFTVSDVTDPANPVVLDGPRLPTGTWGWGAGVYMIWNVSGQVQFSITTTGSWGAMSAWFVDAPQSADVTAADSKAATAVFVQQDDSTRGTWVGKYGSQGYSLLGLGGEPDVIPAGCSVSFANGWLGIDYIAAVGWGSDAWYLQIPSMPGYIGAYLYRTYGTMTLTVQLDDGLTHALSIYYADSWASQNTSVYDVTDPGNPILLDGPRSVIVTATHGVYLTWNAKGTVQFAIAPATDVDSASIAAWFIDAQLFIVGLTHTTDCFAVLTTAVSHGTDSFMVPAPIPNVRTIMLLPTFQRHFIPNVIDGFRFTLQVVEANMMPSKIFRYRVVPTKMQTSVDQPPTAVELAGVFDGVCSPADLEDFPEDWPLPNARPPWYRLDHVDLIVRSRTIADMTYKAILVEITNLVKTLNLMDQQDAAGIIIIGPEL